MKAAEKALKASEWAAACECVRTEYPARDLSILDLLPPGISKGWALERLAARLGVDRRETMAIGDNWNDAEYAGVGGTGNRDGKRRRWSCERWRRRAAGSRPRRTTTTALPSCWSVFWQEGPTRPHDGIVRLEFRFRMSKRIYIPAIFLAALAALPPLARAGERVTLRNGFVELCDHHAEVEGRVAFT